MGPNPETFEITICNVIQEVSGFGSLLLIPIPSVRF